MKIPELEELAKKQLIKPSYTDDEVDTICRYYNRVPVKELLKYLPGRTYGALRVKVQELKKGGVKFP